MGMKNPILCGMKVVAYWGNEFKRIQNFPKVYVGMVQHDENTNYFLNIINMNLEKHYMN
jgi:hypothetical protein